MVKIRTISKNGEVQKIVLYSDNKVTLNNVDYELNPKPHDRGIVQLADGAWEMVVSADEMSRIIVGFSCRD